MTEQRRPTMTDVATLAGVSQTTVSLVLNGIAEARVSDDTITRVKKAAKSLGYLHAGRRNGNGARPDSGVIGFLVDEMSTDPWMAIALDGLREKAASSSLDILTFVTSGDAEAEEMAIRTLARINLRGLVYGTIQTRAVTPSQAVLGQPTVLLNCYVMDRSVASVTPGEVVGGRTATRHLIELGHRRIAIIQGEDWMDASKDRLKGYRQALAAADIAFDEDLVRPGNWEPSAGYAQTKEMMQLPHPPTAIFCCNDLMALGCLEALRELGKAIPGDVSVVGYDDREIAQFTHPPLTTVLLPHFEMGALAAELLLEQIDQPGVPPAQLKSECPLVVRNSSSQP
ncbi:MAG: LacI family DNA-binding transcriptional regulator [Rhizobiales bacterium]|nr:LacI family DNA-binding transcriptional regulator [Hyphomicrobiales bacterium]